MRMTIIAVRSLMVSLIASCLANENMIMFGKAK